MFIDWGSIMPVRLCFRSEVGLSQGLSRSHSRSEQIVRFSRLTRSLNFETFFITPSSYNQASWKFEHILVQNVVESLAQNIVQSWYCSWSERLCMVNGLVPHSVFFFLFVCFCASLPEAQHNKVSSWFICLFSVKEFSIWSLLTLTR